MKNYKNALIGQSGGPTTVINSSLAGVIARFLELSPDAVIYGAQNGIQGVLREDFINLNDIFKDNNNLEILKQTPSSYLGSCRYKLKKDDDSEIDKIISILEKNEIGYFFYIGGNDSMDTVMRLSEKCADKGINAIGIPKTIDNDLVSTDHCPGYGSCAKYIATTVSQMALDASCYDIKNVLIVEIMGRNAGWLTASSALANGEHLKTPDLIYLPEKTFDDEKFLFDIRQKLLNQNTVVICVSEGIKYQNGTYVSDTSNSTLVDAFGHKQLGGTGKKLENLVKTRLGIKVRSVELNIAQRCASHIASLTDITEAFNCGKKAVEASLIDNESGKMVSMVRNDGDYNISYKTCDIKTIANMINEVPDNFINADANYVTDEFIKYAYPLILGENSVIYENGIPKYIKR